MTQDSESVVVLRDQQRQLDAEQLMDAAGTLSRCGYGEDAEEVRAIALRLAAAPSTSVREEVACEACLATIPADEAHTVEGFTACRPCFPVSDKPEDSDRFLRGRCHRSLAALVPSTDEGKRHG